MQASTFHNTEVYVPLTKNIQQAHSIMERIIESFTTDEIHLVLFNWMDAVPQNKEVNIIFKDIHKLIRKHSFKTLLDPAHNFPGYNGNRNLSMATTFMLLFYLTQCCWELFGEMETDEKRSQEYKEEFIAMEELVRNLDLTIIMNSMFDILKRTVGADFLTSFWLAWEAENKNYDREADGVIRSDQEQLILDFMILRGFVDVCFFIFNYKEERIDNYFTMD